MRGVLWRPLYPWRPYNCRLLRQGVRTITNWPGQPLRLQSTAPTAQVNAGRRHTATLSHDASQHEYLEQQDRQLTSILNKAPHGIDTLDRLAFEADVGHVTDPGSRLTDLPVNRQDLDLWLVLLEYRLLQDDLQGVKHIVRGMKSRGPAVKLLEYDASSDRVWSICLTAALEDNQVLYMLADPDESIARDNPTLFLDLVTALLDAGKPDSARIAAMRLRNSHFHGRKDLVALLQLVLKDTSAVTLDDFCTIHHILPFTRIYAHTVPLLWRAGRSSEALGLHHYLIDHHDYPPTFECLESLVGQLAQDDKPLQPFLVELENAGLSFSAQARSFYAQAKAYRSGVAVEAIDLISVSRLNTRQRKLSDQFVAKILATTSLSFEFAIKSLKFFGLVEIGPLAVREMGISATTISDLQARFRLLQELEIDTGSSNFVIVVKNLCLDNSPVLLDAVLKCDQHHEVFEDWETQKRLLTKYYFNKDWPQVNRTLAVLNRGKTGLDAQLSARRMLLTCAIIVRDWRDVLVRLNAVYEQDNLHIFDSDAKSPQDLLDFIIATIIARDKHTKSSDDPYLHRIKYLTGVLQNMEFSGFRIAPKYWKSLLFRLGEVSMFTELETLALWLASFHTGGNQKLHDNTVNVVPSSEARALDSIFDSNLQAAILAWDTLVASHHYEDAYTGMPFYRRGLDLLLTLEMSYGLLINRAELRQRYRTRLVDRTVAPHLLEQYMKTFDEVMKPVVTKNQPSASMLTATFVPFHGKDSPEI